MSQDYANPDMMEFEGVSVLETPPRSVVMRTPPAPTRQGVWRRVLRRSVRRQLFFEDPLEQFQTDTDELSEFEETPVVNEEEGGGDANLEDTPAQTMTQEVA